MVGDIVGCIDGINVGFTVGFDVVGMNVLGFDVAGIGNNV